MDTKSHIIVLLCIILIFINPKITYANEIEEAKVCQKDLTLYPEADWKLVEKYCTIYDFTPYLIVAIGWHETHWRRLGAGIGGWVLGFGYYPGSRVKEKYRGLEAQLKGACPMIAKYFKFPVTQQSCIDFAIYHYKPGVPTAWGKSVYQIYSGLEKGITPQPTPTEIADVVDKVKKLDLIVNFLIAFGDQAKEAWGDE